VCKIKDVSKNKIEEKLELVGLLDRKDSKFRNFSLGMKQRLAIASALLNDPEILILDEPTNGLDPQGIHQIREIIKKIATQGTTILLASHLLDEVEKVCSHVVILRKGEKLYSGTVDGMLASHGFFELKTKQTEALYSYLKGNASFGKISSEDGITKALLKEEMSAETLNKVLFDKGIVLSHLVKRKESLEEQFCMIRLLQIEFIKLWNNRASKGLIIAYFILLSFISLISIIKFPFGNGILLADMGIFNFPYVWHFNTWIAALFKLFLAIVIVSMMANEYSNKTLKQNLIDGLSKKEFILSKFLTVVTFSIVSTIFVFIISLVLGLTYSNFTEFSIIIRDLEFFLAYFVKLSCLMVNNRATNILFDCLVIHIMGNSTICKKRTPFRINAESNKRTRKKIRRS